MRAYAIQKFGPPSNFSLIEVPEPAVEPGQLLIHVAASSVNPLDCKMRQGKLAAITADFPAILHGDVAGVVVQVGEGVSDFKVGDEVFACAGGVKGSAGAIAEFMLADAKLVAHKPATLSMLQSAVLPLVSITAWNALVDRANLQAGQSVLIHGGTGGVGHIGVQLAKIRGAKVYATVSNEQKSEQLKKWGVQGVINYRNTDVQTYVDKYTNGKGFDVVFDTVGGENLQRSFQAAGLQGTVVSVSTRSEQDLSLMHAKSLSLHVVFMLIPLLHNIHRETHGEILRNIARYVDAGKIAPLIDSNVFGFSHIAEAHQHWECGAAKGKIALVQDIQ